MNEREQAEIKVSLKRSKRIITYMMINIIVWIGSMALLQFYEIIEQQSGIIIVGTLAVAFFWLFIQQKIIAGIYLKLLHRSWDQFKVTDDKLLNKLSEESTEKIKDVDGVFDIKQISKADKDEDLV